MTRDEAVTAWLHAKKASAYWQAEERKLRDMICTYAFGYTPDTPAQSKVGPGTHKLELGNGYGLKLVASETFKIKEGPAWDSFVTQCRTISGGVVILDAVRKLEPKLVKAGFEAQHETVRAAMLPAIERKPSAPQLDFVEPKA